VAWGILAIYAIGIVLLFRMAYFQSFVVRAGLSPGARVAAKLCFAIIWTALAIAMLGLALGIGALSRAAVFLFPVSLVPVIVQGERARRRSRG
jgi:hypothetical protein